MSTDDTASTAAFTVPQVMAKIGVGRNKVYCAIREGKLPACKLGRRTLILATDLEAFLKSLPVIRAAA